MSQSVRSSILAKYVISALRTDLVTSSFVAHFTQRCDLFLLSLSAPLAEGGHRQLGVGVRPRPVLSSFSMRERKKERGKRKEGRKEAKGKEHERSTPCLRRPGPSFPSFLPSFLLSFYAYVAGIGIGANKNQACFHRFRHKRAYLVFKQVAYCNNLTSFDEKN